MRRTTFVVALGLMVSACPADDVPSAPTTHAPPDTTTAPTTADTEPDPDSGSSDTAPEAWLELGWGVTEYNPLDGTLPIVVGPQGLAMFSLPPRGAGFHNPPDPGFDNPDMPILQAWLDVDRYANSPGGHLTEVVDYPALFYPSFDDPGVLEGPAVWLVIPDDVEPEELVGLAAHLHAEMVDADGLELVVDHDLVIGDVPPEPPGP